MALIAGASRFVNQAMLSNQQGISAQSSNVLGTAAGSVGILDVGRNLEVQGVGISNRARNLNRQFLESTSGTYNQLFSASGGASATVEGALIQIKALQSDVPTSRDSPQVREAQVGAQEQAAAERGSVIDESI